MQVTGEYSAQRCIRGQINGTVEPVDNNTQLFFKDTRGAGAVNSSGETHYEIGIIAEQNARVMPPDQTRLHLSLSESQQDGDFGQSLVCAEPASESHSDLLKLGYGDRGSQSHWILISHRPIDE